MVVLGALGLSWVKWRGFRASSTPIALLWGAECFGLTYNTSKRRLLLLPSDGLSPA